MAAFLALAACLDPAIQLDYQLRSGETLEYEWTIEVTTNVDIAPQTSSSKLRLVMDVEQTVLGEIEDGVRVRFTIDPTVMEEDGVRLSPPPRTGFEVELDRRGRVSRVIRAGQLSAVTLRGLEIRRLLQEILPPLPPDKVAIGDGWEAGLRSRGESTRLNLKGQGRLEGYRLRQGRRLARIEIERRGRVLTHQRVGRVMTDLAGASEASTVAEIDVDAGALATSFTRSESDFEVSQGGQPAGSIRVTLVTSARLAA